VAEHPRQQPRPPHPASVAGPRSRVSLLGGVRAVAVDPFGARDLALGAFVPLGARHLRQ